MSRYCGECEDLLPADGAFASCVGCSGNFHFGCTTIKKKTYDSMCRTRKDDWRCSFCRTVRTLGDNLVNRLGIDKLQLAISDLKSTIDTVNAKIEDCIKSQKFISEQFDVFKAQYNNLTDRVVSLEDKISIVSNSDSDKDNKIDLLSKQIVIAEQALCDRQIILRGVIENNNENLVEIVKCVANKLNVRLDDGKVSDVYRIRKSNAGGKDGAENVRVKSPICVTFAAASLRNDFLRKKKGVSITNRDTSPGLTEEDGDLDDGVYINEMMSNHFNKLWWAARNRAKEYRWKYVWFAYGNIRAKKDDKDTFISIYLDKDLQKII